jgi:integrase
MTKNRDPHRLHLHALALEILNTRRHALAEEKGGGNAEMVERILATGLPRSGLVFPAPISGRPVDTFTNIKTAVVEATKSKAADDGSELDGWTWHDFRRSFATALGEAGIPETVADAVLNHRQSATRGGVLGVYQRASRWPEQVKAMELWGTLLAAAIAARDSNANVVDDVAN